MTRKTVPFDEVLRALRTYPNGVTVKELAERLGMRTNSLGVRLGKQWMYGGPVDRELGVRVNGAHAQSIWRAR